MAHTNPEPPLHIGLLSYRTNPYSGGQGIYVRHLAAHLRDLGHRVTVISGPPRPALPEGVGLLYLPGLDLYNPQHPFRLPRPAELADPVNLLEWLGVASGGFPEPLVFGLRAASLLNGKAGLGFDVLHDNQSLSYALLLMARRTPLVATIHHPLTMDRRWAVRAAKGLFAKLQRWRWYSPIGMQKRVARRLPYLITVSEAARRDFAREYGVPAARMRVIAHGIDTERFRPLAGIPREPGRILVVHSAEVPLKGLGVLLQALAAIDRPFRLVVVGELRRDGESARTAAALGLNGRLEVTGRISEEELVRQYARACVAVVPSLYEGFGFPAGEAMACGVPVVATTAGALPEVVGEAGLLVPAGDAAALRGALARLIDEPETARRLGAAGRERVLRLFSWRRAARQTVSVYREAIRDHRRFRAA